MNTKEVICALVALGESMKKESEWEETIEKAHLKNQWFTPDFVRYGLQSWSENLTEERLIQFVRSYNVSQNPKNVGIVMAGNIPLVGLHDLICVLLSGHRALVKCSKEDETLIKKVIAVLENNGLPGIQILERMDTQNAVIATGSNNTSRYFEYYFRNSPHLIRKNRTSVAVLTASDDEKVLKDLATDVFMYFGLGCRNVGKIFIPRHFELPHLLDQWQSWSFLSDHNKYINNYVYHKALFLMNRQEHLDNGFLLIKEDPSLFSPLGCLYFERYDNLRDVKEKLDTAQNELQCVVSTSDLWPDAVWPGHSQKPELNVYADGVDTMLFLSQLGGG